MDNITADKLLLLAIFFVPGFIYIKFYRLLVAEVRADFSKDLYEAIGYSFLNAILFSYPLFLIHSKNYIQTCTILYFLIMALIILVSPVLLATAYSKLTQSKWYFKRMIAPTKSAWDSFFSKRESYFVIITLKNGRRVGGKYGMNSYSSTYPNPKEIFIEQVWKLNSNNGFESVVSQTEGMLITENEISTIEFYI